jgi:hypothetical protein
MGVEENQMTEADIEIVLERAKEHYPGVRPRVIGDNGPAWAAAPSCGLSPDEQSVLRGLDSVGNPANP